MLKIFPNSLHLLNVPLDEPLDAVVDRERGVAAGDAVAHEGAHGRVHAAGGGAHVQHGEVVASALAAGGNLEDLNVVLRENVDFVMKDGLVYKNWLSDENAPAFSASGLNRNAYLSR